MTSDITLDAGLPANLDAERVLLGATLLDNAAWEEIRAGGLHGTDFFLDSHRRIAKAIAGLIKNNHAVDIVTLANELNARHEIEAVGGVAYLASLTENLPRRPVIEEYIQIVRNKSVLRQLMTTCSTAIARAQEQSETGLEVTAELMSQLEKLTTPTGSANRAPIANFIVGALEEIDREYQSRQSPCIPSGNAWFDVKTGGGYRQSNITLICARPNVGKTPFAVMSTAYNVQRGTKVVFFSLEKKQQAIFRDLVPYVVDLPNRIVNNAWVQTPEQNRLVHEAANTIAEWPLVIHDGKMDADEICSIIDRETRSGEHVLFIIDHFGMIAGQGNKSTVDQEIYNSGRLRDKIKQKDSALVILRQLKKVNREYADKPPIPDDIKGATNGWEDAFAALILHRTIDADTRKLSKKVSLNLAKLRTGGSTGSTEEGHFNTRTLSFEAQPELEMDYFE